MMHGPLPSRGETPPPPDGNRYWDGDQWTDRYQPPPSDGLAKPKKPWRRRWWVWVLGALVLLTILGALIPTEDPKPSNSSDTGSDEAEATVEPTVSLTVDAPDVVDSRFARIEGSVEATGAEGKAASGSVAAVLLGGVSGRSIEVNSDGSFVAKVSLRKVGENNFEFEAFWAGTDAEDVQTVTIVREQSAAELAAIRERRAAQREAERQELISSAQTIDYDQLMKNPEAFSGDAVTYTGQIFQIQEDPAGGGIVLLAVTDEATDSGPTTSGSTTTGRSKEQRTTCSPFTAPWLARRATRRRSAEKHTSRRLTQKSSRSDLG